MSILCGNVLTRRVKMKKSKKDKVWEVLLANPNMPTAFVAKRAGCSPNYVNVIRQSVGTPKEVFEEEENKKQFNRSKILQSADTLVSKDRADEHGEAMHNFVAIGDLWNAYLGLNNFITPQDVPMMLALLKMARTKENPDNADNYRDLCGYGALAGEVSRNK